MKNILSNIRYKLALLPLMLLAVSSAFAETLSPGLTNPDVWYMNPWLWVGIAAIIIVLLYVLLVGSNDSTEPTHSRKTTTTGLNDHW